MSASDRPDSAAAGPNAGGVTAAGVQVTTHRTITASTDNRDGMTLDELAGFLRRAMAAGISPDTPLRVRASRKGAVTEVSVEGVATSG